MLPKIFDLHLPFGIVLPIYSYGVLILIGLFAAFFVVGRLASKHGLSYSLIADIGMVAVISGFLGAKVSFFINNPDVFKIFIDSFSISIPTAISYLSGGFDFLGGFVLAVPCVYLFLYSKKMLPFTVGDLIAPGLALAHSFGRIGCFMNGCCYGFRTECGVRFSSESAVYYDQIEQGLIESYELQSLAVFPTQLLEAGLLLVLAVVLVFSFIHRKFAGETICIYIAAYGMIRFALQFTRDDGGVSFGVLSIWHLFALAVFAFGVAAFVVLKRKNGDPLRFYRIDIHTHPTKEGSDV